MSRCQQGHATYVYVCVHVTWYLDMRRTAYGRTSLATHQLPPLPAIFTCTCTHTKASSAIARDLPLHHNYHVCILRVARDLPLHHNYHVCILRVRKEALQVGARRQEFLAVCKLLIIIAARLTSLSAEQ